MLEHAGTNSSKALRRAFVRKLFKTSPIAKQIWRWQKIQKHRLSVQSKKVWTASNMNREVRAGSRNTLAKPQKVRKKNKSGNPDSSSDSVAGSKEALGIETLQTAVRSDRKGR